MRIAYNIVDHELTSFQLAKVVSGESASSFGGCQSCRDVIKVERRDQTCRGVNRRAETCSDVERRVQSWRSVFSRGEACPDVQRRGNLSVERREGWITYHRGVICNGHAAG